MDTATASFGALHFGALDLGDVRRNRRLVPLVDTLCRHPGGSLPDKFAEPADLRAFYRLMNRPELTHAQLLRGHADQVRQQIAALPPGTTCLILHDATELDYTSKTTLRDHLGQIGQGLQRGYICHNSLAIRADTGEALGLVSQILHHRADVPANEGTAAKRARLDRESRLWVQGVKASGPTPSHLRCIDVSDSLSDTFEFMAYEVHHQRHFVLRAKENRKLVTPVAGQDYLLTAARTLPVQSQHRIAVLGSPQRRARTTEVQVAFAPVTLAVPGKHLGEYVKQPLDLWVIRVWEPQTPAGEEPLEWLLLTNVPVGSAAEARERIGWYERRPIIEELHKAMKTGCAIEGLQFEKLERLEPAIALLSAVATTLLRLRDAARAPDAEVRPASTVVSVEYIEVLVAYSRGRLGREPSVQKFYQYVGRLGGHQNRKADGLPGWITLWRGWMKLQAMVDGFRAAQRNAAPRCGKT